MRTILLMSFVFFAIVGKSQSSKQKKQKQEAKTPEAAISLGDKLSMLKAQLASRTNKARVYNLPLDNMPCLSPNYSSNMPVMKPNVEMYKEMPNALPKYELIPLQDKSNRLIPVK